MYQGGKFMPIGSPDIKVKGVSIYENHKVAFCILFFANNVIKVIVKPWGLLEVDRELQLFKQNKNLEFVVDVQYFVKRTGV